ncbi:MAG: TRAP transporter small permease [Deltaproteobacteria bacterium]|nr:TRAP transporter small permease [Deltaproteobacteria bacterium]MBW2017542.1 TRAP transporter small permease [Deltaproteobacteria bacterium]MBW2128061.1 TRAP transporter small permease [Deltaproteobacteria bacterium]MBW2304081.1 TRAP transporter small permease [Deltaproteobacteria bacterium]
MLEQVEKFTRRLSTVLEWVGLVAVMFMVLITCADVLGAKIFLRPVFGAIDLVMLAQLVAISFAASATLLVGKHVQVEFFVMMFPARLKAIVDAFIQLLGFSLFVVIVWRLTVYGYHLQISGEVSSTARIPLYFFAYGAALACLPVCLLLLLHFLKIIGKMVGDK